jgi:tetratricopeptide (TPR) repeat protein
MNDKLIGLGWRAVVGFYVWSVCAGVLADADAHRVARLLDASEYREALAALRTPGAPQDPAGVLAYCQAMFAIDPKAEQCFGPDVGAEDPRARFGRAIFQLRKGSVPSARTTLTELRDSAAGKWLGHLGLIEAALLTNDYGELARHLDRVSKSGATDAGMRRYIAYARATLYLETGRLRAAREALSRFPASAFGLDPGLFRLKFRLLWAEGDVPGLGSLLRLARQMLDHGLAYETSASEYLSLTRGPEAERKHLQLELGSRPDRPELAAERVYSLLDDPAADPDEVRQLIEHVVSWRRADVPFLINFAESLTSLRQIETAAPVYEALRSSDPISLAEFTGYHTLQAWNDVYAGRLIEAEQKLAIALERSPFEKAANWLGYLIAKKRGLMESAFAALKRLYILDPFNEYVINGLVDTSAHLKDDAINRKIISNKKWYSKRLREQVERSLH